MSVVDEFVEVKLVDEESFLKIKETLSRIGIASKKDKILYQSCHVLHKQGKYYIVSFKELFRLDGKEANITENDIGRRNTIASLLEDWGLLRIVSKERVKSPLTPISQIKILPYGEKQDWQLKAKYSIGVVKR